MCFIFSKLCLTSDSLNCCAFFFKFFTIYEAVSTVRQFGHSWKESQSPVPIILPLSHSHASTEIERDFTFNRRTIYEELHTCVYIY